eukprot:scaffold34637_cov187-Amphora_coffeaeformis.AAC.1
MYERCKRSCDSLKKSFTKTSSVKSSATRYWIGPLTQDVVFMVPMPSRRSSFCVYIRPTRMPLAPKSFDKAQSKCTSSQHKFRPPQYACLAPEPSRPSLAKRSDCTRYLADCWDWSAGQIWGDTPCVEPHRRPLAILPRSVLVPDEPAKHQTLRYPPPVPSRLQRPHSTAWVSSNTLPLHPARKTSY